MSHDDAIAAALLVLRVTCGGVLCAHGWNHLRGPGGVDGTTRWFESMGMRHPRLHAWLASLTELGCGLLLVAGLLTALGCAGVVGVMAVAWAIAHRGNGFFVFRDGAEYVLMIAAVAVALGLAGAGPLSVDAAVGLDDDLDGLVGLTLALVGGLAGAALTLALGWRRPSASPE